MIELVDTFGNGRVDGGTLVFVGILVVGLVVTLLIVRVAA